MIETVDSAGVDRVEIERDMTVECPYDGVTDEYEVHISFSPGSETPEYRHLSEWLDTYEGREISQESLCRDIRDMIESEGMSRVRVSVSGIQYGMNVTVVKE